jgi:Zn-dependent protease with chaperone function
MDIKKDATVNSSTERVVVEPWHSEMMLKVFVILVSVSVWMGLVISIFGIIYVAFIGLFFFCTHLLFIAVVRGNAIRVGPHQYPDLYTRVERLCQRVGLNYVPETYIMQAGGSLNALATKFLRSRMIIIFSDLLDACEDDERAQDMIIGHEIGHIKQGHLDAFWFLLPGFWVPFLGSAYSRAREYTCDRFGFALAGEPSSALKGLTILAAGKNYGKKVNYEALVKQREQLDTGFMTIGKWLMTHPPICDRVAALDKNLAHIAPRYSKGPARAFGAMALIVLIMVGGTVGGMALFVMSIAKAKSAAAKIQELQNTQTVGYDSSYSNYSSDFQDSAYSTESTGEFDSSGVEDSISIE